MICGDVGDSCHLSSLATFVKAYYCTFGCMMRTSAYFDMVLRMIFGHASDDGS